MKYIAKIDFNAISQTAIRNVIASARRYLAKSDPASRHHIENLVEIYKNLRRESSRKFVNGRYYFIFDAEIARKYGEKLSDEIARFIREIDENDETSDATTTYFREITENLRGEL